MVLGITPSTKFVYSLSCRTLVRQPLLHSIFPIQTEKYSPYLITWIQPSGALM